MSKTVLVTGGNGFVARQLIYSILHNTDWNIVFTVRHDDPLADTNRLTTFAWDVNHVLHREIRQDVDYFVHLASVADVGWAQQHPKETFQTNVMGTIHALEAAKALEVERFIYFSTNEVFGPSFGGHRPKETMTPLLPRTHYGASKAAGEMAALSYFRTNELPVSMIRTMNVFGPRQQPTRLIPTLIRKIMNDEPVQIYGKDTQRRMIHVEDLAIRTIEIMEEGGLYHNVIGANLMKLVDLPYMIGSELNKDPIVEIVEPTRLGYESVYDMDSINESNKRFPFRNRLKETVEWYLENEEWLDVKG